MPLNVAEVTRAEEFGYTDCVPGKNPTERFSSRVDNYVRFRPGYPPEVLELLRRECSLTPDSTIADVASGTGIFTRLLLLNGNRVFGVEPNADMRKAGEEFLSGLKAFTSVKGTAEATTLADNSVDMVTAAQAAHWFDREAARNEFIRILKPGGWIVLLWNERQTDSTPFLRAYEDLLKTYSVDYHEVRHEKTTDAIDAFFGPLRFRRAVIQSSQELDYDATEGRLLSSSYVPQPGDDAYDPMISALRRAFDEYQHNGRVTIDYKTRIYHGRVD